MVSVVFPLLPFFFVCTLMFAPCGILVEVPCVLQNRNLNSEDAGKQWDHRTHWTLYLSRRQLGMRSFLVELLFCPRGREHSGCQVWVTVVPVSCDFCTLYHTWSSCKHLKFIDVLKHVICLKIPVSSMYIDLHVIPVNLYFMSFRCVICRQPGLLAKVKRGRFIL